MTGTRDDGGGRINHGHPMTTPKPASAPQADSLQQIVAEMRASDSAGFIRIGAWADRIEAIAAGAQVREGEPADEGEYGCPFHFPDCHSVEDFDTACRDCKAAYYTEEVATAEEEAAAEPVPVAQGDVAEFFAKIAGWLRSTHAPDYAARLEREVADHARRVAELEKDVLDMADKAIDAYIQRDTAEASLAACRALPAKWRELSNKQDDRAASAGLTEAEREWHLARAQQAEDCADELDAAIDALRQEDHLHEGS